MLQINRDDIRSDIIVDYPVEERFIKLPIEKFLPLLGIEPNPPQIALINAINNPKYRFITACISRRLGKTFIANVIGNLVSLYPNMNILVMSPNYSLSTISWDVQKGLYKKFNIPLAKANQKDRVLELYNDSSLRLGSVAQADSCVGRSYDLIIFDEAALTDGSSAWNVQLRPTLDKLNSKAIFISTPRGNNWFKQLFDIESDEWVSITADWTENPRAKEKDIMGAKDTMSYAEWRQEYYADFTVKEGRIYNMLPECHVDSLEMKVLDTVMGVDLGFRDPTSMVVMQTDGYKWYIVAEYEASGQSTRTYAEVAKELVERYNVDFIYIDSANQQMRYDFAVEYDLYCLNAKKDVNLGIGYCQGLVENSRIYINNNCHKMLGMLNNYAWDPREGLLVEKPLHDKHSHLADAFRYAMYSHSHAMSADPEDFIE